MAFEPISPQDLIKQPLLGLIFGHLEPKLLTCVGHVNSYTMDYENGVLGDMYQMNGMANYRRNPQLSMDIILTNIERPRPIWDLIKIQEALMKVESQLAPNIFEPEVIEKIQGFLVAIDHLLSKGAEDLMVEKLLRAK